MLALPLGACSQNPTHQPLLDDTSYPALLYKPSVLFFLPLPQPLPESLHFVTRVTARVFAHSPTADLWMLIWKIPSIAPVSL
jgi:hypothetical protein